MTTETVWEGRYLSVRKAGTWEYAERSGDITAAVIVAIDGEGQLLLVEQYRVPLGRACLELPAGLVGDDSAGESVAEAARRELEEETGYHAATVEERGEFFSSPGMTSERFTLVVATGLTRTGDGGGDAQENITVHRVPVDAVEGFVAAKRRAGVAIDAKMLLVLGGGLLAEVAGR
ncbi:NUDIX hydrolase [Sphingomonas sp. RP10(2022)]|uniref:GDP-mannose pyrophosphatase n=1 Tax=Sphingomonas liriopis TaxID=2949094 RepID=A0A9X2HXQ1_9SPHN|nr:NUDIX hydrolase [Sphingomonas liriopis]MCP3734720.1 NUDIX hydrolase [Sphingomonas liriopis]